MLYTTSMAKNDYLEGWLDGYFIYRENNGWSVEVYQGRDENKIRRKLFTARRELKVYKTLDAALKEVSSIGFQTEILQGVM